LEPVRHSWATGESIQWIKVHDLPDYVYFNHEIHVNKGIGCASCHGRVDQMPLMYQQNTLQMEWCLNCHRNPGVNLRPTSEIYNMSWAGPSKDKPVWCTASPTSGPTAQGVSCVTKDPENNNPEVALMGGKPLGNLRGMNLQLFDGRTSSDMPVIAMPASYVKFTSQIDLGHFLQDKYHIRTANELSSCEVCHR
jgi:hypothetical protein